MNQETERIAELFRDGEYNEIIALFPAEEPWEEPLFGIYRIAAQYLGTMPATREGLEETWQSFKTLLLQQRASADDAAFLSFAQTVQELLTLCATTLYRTCNDRLKLEYALLQKDVSFEKKEYVIDRMRELLLGADVDFGAILQILDEYSAIIAQEELSGASEAFFLGYLRLLQNAAQIAEDNSLLEQFPPLRLARLSCRLPLREDMTEALEKRKELLELTLRGDEALKDWSFFAPYAESAGISRETLEKAQRKRKRIERLKFWKKKK